MSQVVFLILLIFGISLALRAVKCVYRIIGTVIFLFSGFAMFYKAYLFVVQTMGVWGFQ